MGLRGPKAWEPSERDVAQIKLHAGLGMTQDQCAKLVGIGQSTFRDTPSAKQAFEEGKAQTIARVAGSLVQKALRGDTASAIFYLKTQAGWKEKQHFDHTSSDGSMTPGLSFDPRDLSSESLRELLGALEAKRLTDASDPG